MSNNGTNSRIEMPSTGNIFGELIIQKWAMGYVVNYNEEATFKALSIDDKKKIKNKIDTLIREDIHRIHERDRIHYPYMGYTPIQIIDKIFDSDETQEAIINNIFEKHIPIIESYQLALKVSMKKNDQELKKEYSKKIYDYIVEHTKLLSDRFRSNIQRVLLERMKRYIKDDFIMVIDQFIPEIFFKPSAHLKGIIFRKSNHSDAFPYMATHYQYPIVLSQDIWPDQELVLINVEKQKVYSNPDQELIKEYKDSLKKQLIGGYKKDTQPYDRYAFTAMISNYWDAKLANRHPLFSEALLYDTTPSIIAKGITLTVEEWCERLEHIVKVYKGNRIVIRIPTINAHASIPYVPKKASADTLLAEYPDIYEPLFEAISMTFTPEKKKRLTIIIPDFTNKEECETWLIHLQDMLDKKHYKGYAEMIYEFGNSFSMYEIEELMGDNHFYANLDSLSNEYYPEYSLGKTHLNYKKISGCFVHADIQFLKVAARVYPHYNATVSIIGFHLQEESIFRRYVNIDHPSFVVPVHSPGFMIDIINKKLARKGKFEGIYERDRDRVLFYRDIKARSKDPDNHRKPRGLYDKVRKLQKRNKNKIDKDNDEDKNSNSEE